MILFLWEENGARRSAAGKCGAGNDTIAAGTGLLETDASTGVMPLADESLEAASDECEAGLSPDTLADSSGAASKQMGFRDEIEPFSRICGKLQQFRREATQREKNVARLVPPASLGQTGDLRLECTQIA